MKKINLSIYVIIVITIIFAFGCQPEPLTPPTPNTAICRGLYSTFYSATGVFRGRDTFLFDAQNKYLGRRLGIALVTDYTYDAQNRLISTKGVSNGTNTQEHKFVYGSNNLRIQEDIFNNGFKNATYLYEYDTSNRVSRRYRAVYGNGGVVSNRDTTNYTYTGSNLRPARVEYRRTGWYNAYTYDANGNQLTESRYENNVLITVFSFTFDNKKNPSKAYSFGSTIFIGTEILDTNNQLSRTQTTYNAQGAITNTSTSSVGTFEYNAQDYPSKLTLSDGTYQTFTYQCQ